MIDPSGPADLEPAERQLHRVLAAVQPRALPVGFRDEVMRRVAVRTALAWEWMGAAALAVPALAFLVFQLLDRGDEFGLALNNVIAAGSSSEMAEASFFVDGTVVLALAILGVASLLAAHAAIAPSRRTTIR